MKLDPMKISSEHAGIKEYFSFKLLKILQSNGKKKLKSIKFPYPMLY